MLKLEILDKNLLRLILHDILQQKLVLSLIFIILALSFQIIYITNESRSLISTNEKLIESNEKLNMQRLDLLVEKNSLAENNRVEQIAKKRLEMKRPDSSDEVVINIP